jgi:hypothetical protein
MKKVKALFTILLLASSFVSQAQNNHDMPAQSANPQLIAVVNKANWCAICKANGQRFGAVLMSYAAKGVNIYFNDLTNDSTKAASKMELQKLNVYEAVTTVPRKGMGKLLKSCGLAKDKKIKTEVSGIVTFVDPKTNKQINQESITISDEDLKTMIEKLLKK